MKGNKRQELGKLAKTKETLKRQFQGSTFTSIPSNLEVLFRQNPDIRGQEGRVLDDVQESSKLCQVKKNWHLILFIILSLQSSIIMYSGGFCASVRPHDKLFMVWHLNWSLISKGIVISK